MPLWLLIMVLVKVTSPGPIFFKQERVGIDGKRFTMYKFRSMRTEAEKHTGPVWTAKDDPRRTPLGVILRKTSLDELPQLFNVLRGDMSLVGPRPERPYFVEQFKQHVPKYLDRHRVKTGVTGWAQVNGLRGNTSLEERIKYDLYYIENWSLAFDIKILLRTIRAALSTKEVH
jgi:exopolysaccharide biosynthesis polyprenyl glycosylphosphotransferase